MRMMEKSRIIPLLILLGAIALVAGGGWYFFWRYASLKGIEIDKSRFPVTGIDISGHTGEVDFSRIPEESIHFIYMKATEGRDHVDRRFEENYRRAIATGIPVGVYHFFRFGSDGKEQARHFLDRIGDRHFQLPLVLDVESWGNDRGAVARPDSVASRIESFLEEVERRTGERMLLYTNFDGYRNYIQGRFERNEVWICSFRDPPPIAEWRLWQHSHKGRYPWAEGLVDINTFQGDMKAWEGWLKSQ